MTKRTMTVSHRTESQLSEETVLRALTECMRHGTPFMKRSRFAHDPLSLNMGRAVGYRLGALKATTLPLSDTCFVTGLPSGRVGWVRLPEVADVLRTAVPQPDRLPLPTDGGVDAILAPGPTLE